MRIQITDAIPESEQREELSARLALIGLKVEADGKSVRRLRALHPNLPRIAETYEVAGLDMCNALWDANRVEEAIYWEDVVRPFLFRIPHSAASIMHSVQIARPPHLPRHPEQYVCALSTVEFLLDFDEIAAYFAGNPNQRRPPTCFLPVPLTRIVSGLKQSGQYRAAAYWQDQWTLGFLAIPVENCQLHDAR